MNVIFVNGPPGSGKDVVASTLCSLENFNNYRPFCVEKFAMPLRNATKAFFGVQDDDEFDDLKRKDPKIRQFMIGLSEDVVKGAFGRNYFGHACAERLLASDIRNVVISDAGFGYEVQAFIRRLETGAEWQPRYEMWRIERPGYTFKNDSRDWLSLPEEYGSNHLIVNDKGVDALVDKANSLLRTSVWEKDDR